MARHLNEHGVKHMMIANRTRERARVLAQEVNAEVITLPEIDSRLAEADIVISSTASPLPIIGKGMVERALKARRNRPMLLVDIAVPRDIEADVEKLSNVYLYTVDDLEAIIEHNLAQRRWRHNRRNPLWCRKAGTLWNGCAPRARSIRSANTANRPKRSAPPWPQKPWH